MQTVYANLRTWARRTTTSFADLWAHSDAPPPDTQPLARGELIYRLKNWPDLPPAGKTADVYRVLSVMSNRAVNRTWILATCRLAPHEVDALLRWLVRQGAVEVIDVSHFANAAL
ncbi:hypothetical protein [Ramlibacter sp.]|uniref:hypothetical protein n=1 Tax=Ramlibacter sp. TaxID=1917967 RepID=UPI00182A3512|nr:hypothetical protein [Ramlibacter sp.]MBA2676554.1 hypothetical protein [Ramlibacter sp.]